MAAQLRGNIGQNPEQIVPRVFIECDNKTMSLAYTRRPNSKVIIKLQECVYRALKLIVI